MPNLLERYRAGERRPVWDLLRDLGDRVREGPISVEALAVARETMSRARSNIERLIGRLDEVGYRFTASRAVEYSRPANLNPFTRQPLEKPLKPSRKPIVYCPPSADVAAQISELEGQVGVLPLSVRAWYEVVGEVNLKGSYPGWNLPYLDPLVMPSLESLLHQIRPWETPREGEGLGREDFAIHLPDYVSKDGFSGASYWIEVPNAGADAPLEGWSESTSDEQKTYFVDYLRLCFRFGGFPGFERRQSLRRRARAMLTRDLLPI
jgi:hypothetical protein